MNYKLEKNELENKVTITFNSSCEKLKVIVTLFSNSFFSNL